MHMPLNKQEGIYKTLNEKYITLNLHKREISMSAEKMALC